MDWFVFLIASIVWVVFFSLAREKTSMERTFLLGVVSIIFGLMLSTGISFPSGTTTTISNGVTNQTLTYTTYLASLSGSNSFPLLWGASWGLVVFGLVGLVWSFYMMYQKWFNPKKVEGVF